jgi:hypothetical protein
MVCGGQKWQAVRALTVLQAHLICSLAYNHSKISQLNLNDQFNFVSGGATLDSDLNSSYEFNRGREG